MTFSKIMMKMMKQFIIRIATMFVFAAVLLSCAKEDPTLAPEQSGSEFTLRLVQTKTVLEGNVLKWVEGDKVNLFHAEAGTENFVSDGPFEFTGDNTFKGFIREGSIVTGKEYDWYVLYPYDENMASPKAAPIHITPDQYQSEDGSMVHIAGVNCPLAGKATAVAANSTITVNMKHLATVVKIKVTNYESNPMNLELVSFRADGATHVDEEVNIINGDLPTITGSFEVDITGNKFVYNHVNKGMGSGSSRPLLHLQTPKTLGLNESATVYLATIPFHIPNASTLTVGMNKNSGGVTQGIYGRAVSFKAGQICAVRQGSRIAPPFKDGINFYHGKKNSDGTYEFQDGWWRCDLPIDFQFSGEFNFADLFYSFNTGDAAFSLHAVGNQNDKAGNNGTAEGNEKCDELASCCQGYRWVRNKRFDHNFNVNYSDKSGLFFHCYAGYNVGTWEIWFRLEDPLESLIQPIDGDILMQTTPTINGKDLWEDKYWAPLSEYKNLQKGDQVNICEFYASNPSCLAVGESSTQDRFNMFYNNWKSWYVANAAGEKMIWNDGHSIQMSEYVAKFCKQSRGVYWQPAWLRRFDRETNAYVPGGESAWDGGAEAAKYGLSITSDGKLVASSDYDGSAFDFSPSLAFEYDYGYAQHIGTKYLPFICVR